MLTYAERNTIEDHFVVGQIDAIANVMDWQQRHILDLEFRMTFADLNASTDKLDLVAPIWRLLNREHLVAQVRGALAARVDVLMMENREWIRAYPDKCATAREENRKLADLYVRLTRFDVIGALRVAKR
jgi:hypothetical protein